MEPNIELSFTPLQLLLSLALQLWIVVFPILILRKLNYLAEILSDRSELTKE